MYIKGVLINKYLLVLMGVVIIDIMSSILIPIYLRTVNPDTTSLRLCSIESGYKRYSNVNLTASKDGNIVSCLGEEFSLSTYAIFNYVLSIMISLILLYASGKQRVENVNKDLKPNFSSSDDIKLQDLGDNEHKKSYEELIDDLVNPTRTVVVFFLRNICLFNMINFVSKRDNGVIIIETVRLEITPFIYTLIASSILSTFIISSLPNKSLYERWKINTVLFFIINMITWIVIVGSIIYYIGATNVLGRNVLSMYDLRGPELLTINYWNYGILLIIYLEYILFKNYLRKVEEHRVK
jgi:hypothetical protein